MISRRSARLNTGLRGLWNRITGRHALIERQNEAEAYAALRRDRTQHQELIDAQLAERQQLQTHIRAARDPHAELLWDVRGDPHRMLNRLRSVEGPIPHRRLSQRRPGRSIELDLEH